jgi:hypothetical protein
MELRGLFLVTVVALFRPYSLDDDVGQNNMISQPLFIDMIRFENLRCFIVVSLIYYYKAYGPNSSEL